MKTRLRTLLLSSTLLPLTVVVGAPADQDSPLAAGAEVLASVNGEPITLEDLVRQLGALHQNIAEPGAMVERPDPRAMVDRLINVRLVLQEAESIGLPELPEVIRQLDAARLDQIREAVVAERLKRVTEGDPGRVSSYYQEAVRRVEVEAVTFSSEEEAGAFRAELDAGADFGQRARQLLETRRAVAYQEPQTLEAAKLQPEVATAILDLEPGSVSSPIKLAAGPTLVRLLEVRYPEDPAARAEAERLALAERQQIDLGDYARELRAQYAVVNEALVDSLDYDGPEADLEALRGDSRIVAEIRGGEPIRVKDLTARMEKKMFHGLDRAAAQERATEEVPGALDRLIQERAVMLEARRLGIEERPEFQAALRERQNGLLFGTFVSRVIHPKVKYSEEDLRAYYAEHLEDYSVPAMMRLEGLTFGSREDADNALGRLRQGADLRWMKANASGQVSPEAVSPEWGFGGRLLSVDALPEEAQAALAGASAGDYRFCAQTAAGPFHVLAVAEEFPSRPQRFEEVKEQVAVRVFTERRQRALEEWIAKLRVASDVQVMVDEGQLRALLGLDAPAGG